MATEAKADHPWRKLPPAPTGMALYLAYALWSDDNYDRMELEAFVEKRS